MIKKATLLTAFSVTAFSAWAQDTSRIPWLSPPTVFSSRAARFWRPLPS
ncbi:vitamin B12/cobalamin outer membrane transporter [Salmonella enterica subsp. enterica serovar Saintpaul str. S-70]|nr:vitamin B12/cobalamin outer membrane transporter [Salmonella enterica subsp. enterica serovar Saintpaul str. S-70]